MSRRLLAVLGVLATVFVLAARAEDRLPLKIDSKAKSDVKRTDGADPRVKIEDAANQQEALKRQFDDFKQKLLGLAQRMENSAKPEDREKAKILRLAIKKASEEGVETKFSSLIDTLKTNDAFKNTEQLQEILKQNEELRRNLREIMDLLLKDDRDAELRRKKEEYARLLEELKTVIRKQELVLNKTILPRTKNKDLAESQSKVRKDTDALVNPKANKGAEAKHGEGKDSKPGKEGVGEAKNDTKDPKADSKEGQAGEGKDGKSGEGKDGKSGEGKDGKQGEGKDGKSGEGKDAKAGEGKEAKAGEGKEAKAGEGKDGKAGEGKDGKDGKPGEGKDGKAGQGKDGKPGESKPGDAKPGESKAGESKSGEPKKGDSKGKGEGKGDSKGKAGQAGKSGEGKQGEGKAGQSGQPGQPQQGQQGEAKSGGSKSGPPQQQPSQEQSQIKKKIEDAEKYQERAEDNLRKDNRKDAPEDEEAALNKLNEAKKQLEDLLRQLREEEIERLLARLEARCRHMLALQKAVRDGTVELDKVIKANPKSEPGRADQQASNVLSDKEDEIVKEATAGLRLLEAEGSAVAFAEVFQQVRGDMQTVATRLRKTDTGIVTVTIENQIIETLEEMIEALKKAQADNKNKSKSPPPGQSGPPPDPKLIDLLAELKMIRSMQKRVNARTELYGKQYAGEQAPPPENASTEDERERYDRIQHELKDLSKRQEKIGKVTHDIATGKNEAK